MSCDGGDPELGAVGVVEEEAEDRGEKAIAGSGVEDGGGEGGVEALADDDEAVGVGLDGVAGADGVLEDGGAVAAEAAAAEAGGDGGEGGGGEVTGLGGVGGVVGVEGRGCGGGSRGDGRG